MNGSETILCNLVHVNKKKMSDVKIRMKTHKLTLHCRNNDILFLRKDKYSKQACYTFKFHPEITLFYYVPNQNKVFLFLSYLTITKTRMSTNNTHNQQNT